VVPSTGTVAGNSHQSPRNFAGISAAAAGAAPVSAVSAARAAASIGVFFIAASEIRPVHVRHHSLTTNRSRQRRSEAVML